ncbi:MAG: PHB depolymerase family esterase [Gammaproteobacteria bacterium]
MPQQRQGFPGGIFATGNNALGCFNWFLPGDISRDQGEALSIKQMIDAMKADHGSDSTKVFVTGLSAGGAMTAVIARDLGSPVSVSESPQGRKVDDIDASTAQRIK